MWKYVTIFLLVACSPYTKEQFCHSPSKGEILTPTLAPPLTGKHHPQRESVQLAENEYVLLGGRNGFPEILVDSGQRPLVITDNKNRRFPNIPSDTVMMNIPLYTVLSNGRDFIPDMAEYEDEAIERDTQQIRQKADLTQLALEWLDPDQWNKRYNFTYYPQQLVAIARANFFGLAEQQGLVGLFRNGDFSIIVRSSSWSYVRLEYLDRVIGQENVRKFLQKRAEQQLVNFGQEYIEIRSRGEERFLLTERLSARILQEFMIESKAYWQKILPNQLTMAMLLPKGTIFSISGEEGLWVSQEVTSPYQIMAVQFPTQNSVLYQSPVMELGWLIRQIQQAGKLIYKLVALSSHPNDSLPKTDPMSDGKNRAEREKGIEERLNSDL